MTLPESIRSLLLEHAGMWPQRLGWLRDLAERARSPEEVVRELLRAIVSLEERIDDLHDQLNETIDELLEERGQLP